MVSYDMSETRDELNLTLRYNLRSATKRERVGGSASAGEISLHDADIINDERFRKDGYQHEPLDLTKSQFRLLRIFRSSNDIIRCSLEVCSMDQYDYLALSYTWGPENPSHMIEIDGKEFRVRKNLWWFLQYCASGRIPHCLDPEKQVSCYLWIDQVCIDQSSNKEKSHQVSLMSTIYRKAKRVVAWLGKKTEESSTCMDFLSSAAAVHQAQLSDPMYDQMDPNMRFGVRFRNSLDAMCRQSYWRRFWIIQEFALAQELSLVWGDSQLCLKESNLEEVLFRTWRANRSEHIFYRLCDTRRDLRKAGTAGLNLPLIEICLRFIDFECTDQRDTFYALLGLVRNDQRVLVDYSRRAEDIFWDVVTAKHLDDIHARDYEETLRPKVVLLLRRLNITGLEAGAFREEALCNLCKMYPGVRKAFDREKTSLSITELCLRIQADNGERWSPFRELEGATLQCLCGEFAPGTRRRMSYLNWLPKRPSGRMHSYRKPVKSSRKLSSRSKKSVRSGTGRQI
jgi:hypothetical protein